MPFPESELAQQRFAEIEPIGQGAVGVVYRARDRRLNRPVAVKEVAADLAPDRREEARRRFEREAQLVARLSSPQVVAVYGAEDDPRQGERYLYLEYVPGGTLAAALQAQGRLAESEAVAVARDLARAVAAHWTRGIVHRDIKPSNVLVVRDAAGRVAGAKLADYGIAQDLSASQYTQLVPGQGHPGTPGYLSPEQASSQGMLSAASDLYNVGLLLWEMLTGEPRYRRPHAPIDAATLGASARLALIARRALEPDPARRYADPDELARDLEATAAGGATEAAPPPADAARRIGWRGRRRLAGAALTSALLLVVFGLVGVWALESGVASGATPTVPAKAVPASEGADPAAVATANAQLLAALPPGAATATAAPTAPAPTAAAVAPATPTPAPTATPVPAATATPVPSPTAEPSATPSPTPLPPPTAIPPPTATPLPPPAPPTATPLPAPPPAPNPPAATGVPGGELLYSSDKEGRWAIYALRTDGSGERRLTDQGADNYNPAWSPDGQRIAFVSERDGGNRELYVMNADGSGLRRLTSNAAKDEAPAWSPDGRLIAFVSDREDNRGAIYLMSTDGSNVRPLVNAPAGWMSWSRRGEAVFTRRVDVEGRQALFVTTLGAPGVRQITTPSSGDDDAPCYSPDGSRIAFSSGSSKTNRQIVVTNADGGNRQYLTNLGADTSNPVWSPDGGWIAFASDRTGTLQLYVMRADGSDARAITSGPGKKWYLAWKP